MVYLNPSVIVDSDDCVSGSSNVFSAVSPQGVTAELPDFLLQLPPAIERARTSEGSFGSVHLSPANISLVNGEYFEANNRLSRLTRNLLRRLEKL